MPLDTLKAALAAGTAELLLELPGDRPVYVVRALDIVDPAVTIRWLGVWSGNNPATARPFETWLGRPVDVLISNIWQQDRAGWVSGSGWQFGQFANEKRPIVWGIPMICGGETLAQGASGAFRQQNIDCARKLVSTFPNAQYLFVRPAWEHNGTWQPWSAAGKEADYVKCWRGFVDAFRSVSPKFRFDYCANWGQSQTVAETAYPGDAYVDLIGFDYYDDRQWANADPVQAWNYAKTAPTGFNWLAAFAKAHGKRISLAEWGVNADNRQAIVQGVKAFIVANNVLYHGYWDSNADFSGQLSGGQYPVTGAAYKSAFA